MKRVYLYIIAAIALFALAIPPAQAIHMDDWATDSVSAAFQRGIIAERLISRDYTGEITRAEFCGQIMRLYARVTGERYYAKNASPFTDTYDTDVSAAYELGIVSGVGGDRFDPYASITRQELSTMLTRLLAAMDVDCTATDEEIAGILAVYSDRDDIAPWAQSSVAALTKSGYMNGTGTGFTPQGKVAIQQAIVLSLRVYEDNAAPAEVHAPVISNLADGQILPLGEAVVTWDCDCPSVYHDIAFLSDSSSYLYWRSVEGNAYTIEENELSEGIPYDIIVRTGDAYSAPLRIHYGKKALKPTFTAGGVRYGPYAWLGYENFEATPALLYTPLTVTWEPHEGAVYYEVAFAQSRTGYEDRAPALPTLTANTGATAAYTIPMLKPVRYYELTVSAHDADGAVLSDGQLTIGTGQRFSYEYKYQRSNGESTLEEAAADMKTVSFPIWKLDKNGNKTASTSSVTVCSALANDVIAIFTEIFNGPEQFPFNAIGGYRVSSGEHGRGTAIDLNADQNYCIYTSGQVVGSLYAPFENPYSILPDGDVVTAFEKYGWVWGGDAWSGNIDYMHFSYNGR